MLISGQRTKLNVIRADRADGIYLKNFTVEYSDFNNIYMLETNGFRMEDIKSRYSREYGFLSFTSDHGLYERLEAYGVGDSGVYPGSGPEGHCARYGIEIRNFDSHHNTIGYSGTAGNGVWAHDNAFHHNSTGMTTDSFASGHPGMPQDCAKWEHNRIYSNNEDYFNDRARRLLQAHADPASATRRSCARRSRCRSAPGIGIFGGNGDIVRDNYIYDNWRDGVKLLHVPAAFRGEPDKGIDTSFDNTIAGNTWACGPTARATRTATTSGGTSRVAATAGRGNVGPGGAKPTSNVADRPARLPGLERLQPGHPRQDRQSGTCSTWDPFTNPDPPGCDWFTRPEEPK